MRWIGQHIWDQVSKFRNTVDFSEDVTFYQPVNDADPKISIGSSDDERLKIRVAYQGTTTQSAQLAQFITHTESGTANDGRFQFWPDEVKVLSIDDGGIDFEAGFGISINGTDILTDSSGTATLSNIDALDATTISTLNAALTAGDITGVTAGTGMTGGGTSGALTLNVIGGTGITANANDIALTNGLIADGSNITSLGTLTALTVDNIGINGDTITASGDLALVATGNDITVDSDTFTITSSTADQPIVKLLNTTDDDQASQLVFEKLRDDDAVANGQNLGEIWFRGQDSAQNTEDYAYIHGEIDVSASGQESGKLKLGLANHDGGNGAGLILTGGSEDNEIDVTVGLGANSVVTIPGNIDLAGDIDVDGTLETDALTIAGATIAAIGTSSITTLGTIGTGVWEGTAIATDQQKHLMHYEFMGFNNSTADTVYEFAESMNDTKAPLEHTADHNATITTAMVVGTYFKAGGQVIPQAGTIKRIVGWAHSNGTSAEHKLALVMLRPAENDSTAVAPVLVDEITWTSLGGNKLKAINETTITAAGVNAGDILMTMIKDDTGGRQVFFNITVELEV